VRFTVGSLVGRWVMRPTRQRVGLRRLLLLKSAEALSSIRRMNRSAGTVSAVVGTVGPAQLLEQPAVLSTQLSCLTAGAHQLLRKNGYYAAQLFQPDDRLALAVVGPSAELRIPAVPLQGSGVAMFDRLLG
jgi:hypothetical protein